MAVVIGGVTYRRVSAALVVSSAGDPVENLTGGLVYAATDPTTALLLAEYPSGVPVSSVTTNQNGITPDLYVAFPVDAPQEGFIDWPDDGIPAQAITATAAELADWQRSFVLIEVQEALAAVEAAKTETQLARQAAEAAAASAAAGGTGGSGNAGIFEVSYTGSAWEYLTLAAALAAGMKSTDRAWFLGAPRTVSPPSWIRDGDLVGYAGATA